MSDSSDSSLESRYNKKCYKKSKKYHRSRGSNKCSEHKHRGPRGRKGSGDHENRKKLCDRKELSASRNQIICPNIYIINTNTTLEINFPEQTFYFDASNGPLSIVLPQACIRGTVIRLILLFKNSDIVTVTTCPLFGTFTLNPKNSQKNLVFVGCKWKIIDNENNNSFYPTNQQVPKLIGPSSIGAALQGHSVALSADGDTVAIGGPNDNSFVGAIWVFVRCGSNWAAQAKLVGTGVISTNSKQGWSVALSADGNTLAAGGIQDNSNIGATWIFIRTGGSWMQQAKLVGTSNNGTSQQGFSVSLSANGNTLAVGANNDSSGLGATWIFVRSGSSWSQQAKLLGSGLVGASQQGYSVSLSANGDTLAIGGPFDSSNIGAIWIFTRFNTIWTQFGSKIVAPDATGTAGQGYSVALSSDGNVLAFGGPFDSANNGASWVYIFNGIAWLENVKLVGIGNVGLSQQGNSIAISSDGNTLAVGGTMDNSLIGATWIFVRIGPKWIQQGNKLVGIGNVGGSLQGFSVALSSEANTLAIGGPGDNVDIGATWIFT